MKKNRNINVGVIGVGWFGEFHARLYHQLTSANLVGVCDTDFSRAKIVAEKLGTQVFESTEALLAEKDIEAVSICTSDQFHLKPALAACCAGKHILIEKPLALNVQECDQIINAAKKTGVK